MNELRQVLINQLKKNDRKAFCPANSRMMITSLFMELIIIYVLCCVVVYEELLIRNNGSFVKKTI